ncbi:glycosyltransferase [Wenzhouxiangella sp. AB-CW3]|uniref:glycosyltransferase n=1 Tax=Wenzhouxiangella sp. AB-CW3 TaxID=2771012 RepID=UPI00168B1849|nr:glycosyltransferase [Wenzhouxiangella sp. AB-CW3]QOC22025.1 glycosyltransferase [Wenzhouxiangella sp. AB-CW3]
MPELIFITALLLAGWTFAGYPALAVWLARRREKAPLPATVELADVTVIVAARNEAERIGARVTNLLESDYPAARLKILVIDDGSSDTTATAALVSEDPRVQVLRLPESLGKAAALNAGMHRVATPLTVFADARQAFSGNAVSALVSAFSDARVGVAAGHLVLPGNESSGLYWRIESALRHAESTLGWAHAASGAIYAIRTPLYQPMPEGLLLDDVWIPLQALKHGFRIVDAPDALAVEPQAVAPSAEFRRKLRTLVGNWQLMAAAPWLLNPWRNPVFFPWLSHKMARLLAPWALLAALIASMVSTTPWMRWALIAQLLAYTVATAALLAPRLARRVPLATAAGSFLLLNLAALLSLPRFLIRPDRSTLWKGRD